MYKSQKNTFLPLQIGINGLILDIAIYCLWYVNIYIISLTFFMVLIITVSSESSEKQENYWGDRKTFNYR